MFNKDFYPTPPEVIGRMLYGYDVKGKVVLEPSAGKGNIVDYVKDCGAAAVLACELNTDLAKIVAAKTHFLFHDFFQVKAEHVSHIDFIVMNPPFSADERHILHAWEIAPPGCTILALCPVNTIQEEYSRRRKELGWLISDKGSWESLGNCFSDAERETYVEIALVRLHKPALNNDKEWEGFFLEEDEEEQANGIIQYNVIRDLVNRYVEMVKLFDKQLDLAVEMNRLSDGFFNGKIGMNITSKDKPVSRAEFKKELQKSAWNYIFSQLNMQKYTTAGLRADINSFVEKQHHIPFTMRNVYRMLEIVVGTTEQRMDKALLEVFDKLTMHYHDNRYRVEGWKTNEHYLMGKKFIMPYCVTVWMGRLSTSTMSGSNLEKIEDFLKALCYVTGDNYDDFISLERFIQYRYKLKSADGKKYISDTRYENVTVKVMENSLEAIQERQKKYPGSIIEDSEVEFGKLCEWAYFKFRAYKKGTIHFEFLSEELWARFNQRIAKLKGYPLFEHKVKDKDKKPASHGETTAHKPLLLLES